MNQTPESIALSPAGSRFVPLVIWTLVVATLLAIPLKIISYGYVPSDDAKRHVAKVISGKAWQDILVMRSDFTLDPSPGWHAILGAAHRIFNLEQDGLITLFVVSMYLLFVLTPLIWSARSECWVLALLTGCISAGFTDRLVLGRPYIFFMTVLVAILFLESKPDRRSFLVPVVTTLLVALAAWIHGSWYLFALPVAAYFLAGWWRQGVTLGVSWVAGSFIGGCLTGHPATFLKQQVLHMANVFGHSSVPRMLTSEIQPFEGSFGFVIAVAVLLVVLGILRRDLWKRTLQNPAFVLGVVGWILGFKIRRFWFDWGFPAMLVWMTLQLNDILRDGLPRESVRRLLISSLACMTLFLVCTSDISGQWTNGLTAESLSAGNEEVAEWLPGEGGIIYSDQMSVFFDTFYENPHASWRYILGFESGLMPEEDLEVLRNIQWNYGDSRAYAPWVKKMKPEDRLIILRPPGAPPGIPGLEWHYAVANTWIGRLPRAETPNSGSTKPKRTP